MKIRNILYIILLTSAIAGCSGSKKQVLDPKAEGDDEKNAVKLNYETALVMDTVIPNPGIKFNEVRKINSSNPPVKLNLAVKPEEKELNLADYYSTVRYVKLKHPFADQDRAFLGNANITISYEQGGMSSSRGMNSSVFLTSNNIIAGDNYFGYHCYDQEGNFIYTIAAMNELPEYNKRKNEVSFEQNSGMKMIYSFSIFDDNCLIYSAQGRKPNLDFHNITAKKTYLSRPYYGGRPLQINQETFISFQYNVRATSPMPFMYSFEIKGDTLCRFMNYNSLPEPKNSANTNPDAGNFYYYNNILSIRQAYNDTIYRFTSPSELTAAYIFDLGSQKLDLNTALFGDKTGKIIPTKWIETDKFAFIAHTENNDVPNNRNNNSVKFFYSYYDKNDGKMYRIPSDVIPEDFIIPNDIKEGMPLSTYQAQVVGGKLYAGYTKAQLESITNNKSFPSLSSGQQEKVKSWLNELAEGEMLLMILE